MAILPTFEETQIQNPNSKILSMANSQRYRRAMTAGSSVLAAAFCALSLGGCHGETTSPLDPDRAHQATSEKKVEIRREKIEVPDLRGVDFRDVARARGLNYVWPEQPRPMRALEAFGCGC